MKKILICFLLLLATGCTMQYNVKIHTDGSVTESVVALKDKNERSLEDRENPTDNETYIFNLATNYYQDSTYDIYEKQYIERNNLIGLKGTTYFKNVEIYQKESRLISNMYSDITYIKNEDRTTLMTVGPIALNRIYDPTLDVPRYPKDCYISISLPFEVINHNADKVDGATYYWLIDENSKDKTIMIEYKDQLAITGLDLYFYLPITIQRLLFYTGLILIILIILGIIILLIKRRMDKNNEV